MNPEADSQTHSFPKATLEVMEGGAAGRQIPITHSPFLIGRGAEAENNLALRSNYISRHSSAIILADDVFVLENRGQKRGLFVNNQLIESRHVLTDGDVITFGERRGTRVIFHMGDTQGFVPEILAQFERASDLGPATRDLRHLSLLLEATATLQSHMSVTEVLEAMVDRAVVITEAERGLLMEVSPEGQLRPLLAREQGGVPVNPDSVQPSRTVVERAISRGQSVVEGDLSMATDSLRGAKSVLLQELRSVTAIPLLTSSRLQTADTAIGVPGELHGVLYLDSRRPVAFSGLDLQILDALAREASSVLEHARLIEKERQSQRLQQELDVAREIQQALLPKCLRRFQHLEAAGMNRPCHAVGGDYFDLIDLESGRAALIIADVSGKGLGAALVTAMLQGAFSYLALGDDPSRVLTHINRFILEHAEVGHYATAFSAILDFRGNLEFVNSGHLPPLRIREGEVVDAFSEGSVPLGLLPDIKYTACTAKLEPGDTLVLYTDGITEAQNPSGEMFTAEQLLQVVSEHTRDSVDEIHKSILEAVDAFVEGADQADDITLLVVRYLGEPGAI